MIINEIVNRIVFQQRIHITRCFAVLLTASTGVASPFPRWFSSAMIFPWKTHGMQIQTFINPNGSHCDVTLFDFLLRDFSRSFSGYLSRHIFCSCLLQNASDFWMKFLPTGCNFCSFFWVHQFCWINFRGGVYAVYVEGFFDSSSSPVFFNFKESFVAPINFVL